MNYSMTFAKALQKAYRGGPPTCGYGPVFADLVESGFDGIEGAVFGDRIAASPSFLDEPGGDRFPIPPTIEQVPVVHLFLAGSADPAIGSPSRTRS